MFGVRKLGVRSVAGIESCFPDTRFISIWDCRSKVRLISSGAAFSSDGIVRPGVGVDEDEDGAPLESSKRTSCCRRRMFLVCGLIALPPRVEVVRRRATNARRRYTGLGLEERNNALKGLYWAPVCLRNKTRGSSGASVEIRAPAGVYS
jgi:hypothetical protein